MWLLHDGVFIRLAAVRHPADTRAVSRNTSLVPAVTQLQREHPLCVVGAIKLLFNVRMLMIGGCTAFDGRIYIEPSESV